MKDQFRQAGRFVQEVVQESARQARSDHGDKMHQGGFTSAAGIALRRIQQKMDGFTEQMKGPGLNETEQALYAQLVDLKSEIESDCDHYWIGSGVDWRPLRQVANRVIRRAKDTES